jgi:hypothetical protein
VSWEDELLELARQRHRLGSDPEQLKVDHPETLLRQIRHYLAEQSNRRRLKKSYDGPRLTDHAREIKKIESDEIEFHSDSKLTFSIELHQDRYRWEVKHFEFNLHIPGRAVDRVRIDLNLNHDADPVRVPRCHFHIGDGDAHIPFPLMSLRLTLHLLCEHIEPDFRLPVEE